MSRALTTSMALCVAITLLAGCGHSDEELAVRDRRIQELEGQLRDSNRQRTELQSRLSELEEQQGQLSQRLRTMGEERGNLQESLERTRRALAELRARERAQQARLATFRQMIARFRQMIDSGRLRVRIVRNRMVIELANNILFDSGRAQLRQQGQQALGEIAPVLASIRNREYQVSGHTDNQPVGRRSRFGSNWHLSTARAVTVTQYLAQNGVPANRLSAAGYADTQPVATNDNEEGRSRNRRIEIVLMPNLDELPDLSSLSSSSTRRRTSGSSSSN